MVQVYKLAKVQKLSLFIVFQSSDKVALCGCIPVMGVVGVYLQTETVWRLRKWEMKGNHSLACPVGLIFLILASHGARTAYVQVICVYAEYVYKRNDNTIGVEQKRDLTGIRY